MALKEEVARSQYPPFFRDMARLEAEAVTLHVYATMAVPGLLQTEDYARAVFVMRRPLLDEETIEQRVPARLARQAISSRRTDADPELRDRGVCVAAPSCIRGLLARSLLAADPSPCGPARAAVQLGPEAFVRAEVPARPVPAVASMWSPPESARALAVVGLVVDSRRPLSSMRSSDTLIVDCAQAGDVGAAREAGASTLSGRAAPGGAPSAGTSCPCVRTSDTIVLRLRALRGGPTRLTPTRCGRRPGPVPGAAAAAVPVSRPTVTTRSDHCLPWHNDHVPAAAHSGVGVIPNRRL